MSCKNALDRGVEFFLSLDGYWRAAFRPKRDDFILTKSVYVRKAHNLSLHYVASKTGVKDEYVGFLMLFHLTCVDSMLGSCTVLWVLEDIHARLKPVALRNVEAHDILVPSIGRQPEKSLNQGRAYEKL